MPTKSKELNVVYDTETNILEKSNIPFKVLEGKYRDIVFTLENLFMEEVENDDLNVSYDLTILSDPDTILKSNRTKKSFENAVSKFVEKLLTE
jgi:hypothetical protein